MRIAVVGAGINGVMAAWALARRGHHVDLFERGEPMGETSSSSTKLLHGGLRYLETGDIALVREGLSERAWWIAQAPQLAHELELLLPVRAGEGRPRWMVKTGLVLYDVLAGRQRLRPHRWVPREEVLARVPGLRPDGLAGAYAFWDGQMDDRALGLWALEQARAAGARLFAGTEVERVAEDGRLRVATRVATGDEGAAAVRRERAGAGHRDRRARRAAPDAAEAPAYDAICNIAGPWAERLLLRSGLHSGKHLRVVRGSHLLVDGSLPCGLLVQAPDDGRVCFILPWQGRLMVGTTEVEQGPDEPIVCSDAERDYLLRVWNATFAQAIGAADVRGTFAGARPLLAEPGDPNANTREHALERRGRVVTVFGGKWTTSRLLGEQVADEVERGAR